jgi:hypothetical protein
MVNGSSSKVTVLDSPVGHWWQALRLGRGLFQAGL